MHDIEQLILSAIISSGVISAVLGVVLGRRTVRIQEDIKRQFAEILRVTQSRREWKERSVSELLGPLYMQFDRTKRAFDRWSKENTFLEAEVIRTGNVTIRDLLLGKGHLTPPALLNDAGLLVAHYDRWLEEYEAVRKAREQGPDGPSFTFVGPKGFPFPSTSEARFRAAFQETWAALYGEEATPPKAH